MKRIVLLQLIALISVAEVHAQNSDKNPSTNDSCLVATKAKHKPDGKPLSLAFVSGDAIKVKLKDSRIIKGTITSVTNKFIVDGKEIDIKNIKWIKKTKPTSFNVIGFVVMTGAGLALLFTAQEYVQDQQTVGDYAIGTVLLVTTGAILLTSRTKFRPEEGDVLKFGLVQQ